MQRTELKRHLNCLKGLAVSRIYRVGEAEIVLHFGRLFPRFTPRRVYIPYGEYSLTLTNTEWELIRFGQGVSYHFSRPGEIERALSRLEGAKVARLDFGGPACTIDFSNGYELVASEAEHAIGGWAGLSSWVLFSKRDVLLCHPDIPELQDEQPG